MLTRSEIKKQMELGNIVIEPFREESLDGPNSYDIHLGNKLMTYYLDEDEILDTRKPNNVVSYTIPEDGFVLWPGILYLGETEEYTETHGLIPGIDGVSSGGRLGLSIHATAGFGDIGFCGKWTLEITVVHPLRVYPGDRIGQIYYERPDGDIDTTYNGKYQGSKGVKPSMSYKDYDGKGAIK